MIVIYVTHVCKDNISRIFLHYFKILIYEVNSEVKGQKMAQNDKNYVCHTPYLKKHILYCGDFWYTYVKWWHLQGGGSKSKKMAQNDKQIGLTSYLRNHISYDCGFWYICVKLYLLQFFSDFINSVFRQGKRPKNGP